MVNQDPQPEVYTTIHDFPVAPVAAGTQNTVNIFTNQANNEELRIYAVAVDIVVLDGAGNQLVGTTDPKFTMPSDFTLTCSVGSNNVPSNAFDLGWIYGQQDQTMSFTVPVLALFQQPLQLSVTTSNGVFNPFRIIIAVQIIAIKKAPPKVRSISLKMVLRPI